MAKSSARASLGNALGITAAACLFMGLTAMGAGVELTPYGKVKADAAYDTGSVDPGNFARWVDSSDGDDDAQFNMTARETRLGVRLSGPDSDMFKTDGLVEVDFYEGGLENKNRLLLRKAYVDVKWLDSGWSLLAGQTSDVISPLVPKTVNYTVGWWVGNVGYRRPQIRITKEIELGEGTKVTAQLAAARTSAHDSGFTEDTGTDDESPVGQGRIACSTMVGDMPVTVGVSGHIGEEEMDVLGTDDPVKFDTWSVNLDVSVGLCDAASLTGELWLGENMDHFLGGIGQGICDADSSPNEIESQGGWIALAVAANDRTGINVGAGMDDPKDCDLMGGQRAKNTAFWGNVFYDLTDAVQLAFEVSYWETEYTEGGNGDAVRGQGAVIYNF